MSLDRSMEVEGRMTPRACLALKVFVVRLLEIKEAFRVLHSALGYLSVSA